MLLLLFCSPKPRKQVWILIYGKRFTQVIKTPIAVTSVMKILPKKKALSFIGLHYVFFIAELANRSPIIIQNSSNPNKPRKFVCTTVRPTVQGATFSMRGQLYHGHYLVISPLHGHGEVANESPLILPRTLSIVGALVLLKRRAGKKCELHF